MSVQAAGGSTKSYIAFTATSAYQNLAQASHPLTLATVVKLGGTVQDLLYASAVKVWSSDITVGMAGSSTLGNEWSDDTGIIGWGGSPPVLGTSDWWILVGTNATPGTAGGLTLYAKDITANTAWVSVTGLTGLAGGALGTSGFVQIGDASTDQGAQGAQWALAAVWAGVALNGTQVDALATNLRTSDWWSNAGGAPDFLVECTSLTPTDIGNNATTYNSNANMTLLSGGSDTSGWTYDGHGAGATQILEPTSDITTTGWTPSTGTTLWGVTGDDSDADWASATLA